MIAKCYGSDAKSNVALIAAAPELLEACKKALFVTHNNGMGQGDGRVAFTAKALNDIGDACRQAIAKAERSE